MRNADFRPPLSGPSVRRAASLLLSLALIAPVSGCVERTLMLRSEPPGAKLVVNGADVGIAPVKLDFDTYGVFEVIASAAGHERFRVQVPITPPWYEQIPLDFFSEMVWPATIHDDHDLTLTLRATDLNEEAGVDLREQQLRERVEAPSPAPAAGTEGK